MLVPVMVMLVAMLLGAMLLLFCCISARLLEQEKNISHINKGGSLPFRDFGELITSLFRVIVREDGALNSAKSTHRNLLIIHEYG